MADKHSDSPQDPWLATHPEWTAGKTLSQERSHRRPGQTALLAVLRHPRPPHWAHSGLSSSKGQAPRAAKAGRLATGQ